MNYVVLWGWYHEGSIYGRAFVSLADAVLYATGPDAKGYDFFSIFDLNKNVEVTPILDLAF